MRLLWQTLVVSGWALSAAFVGAEEPTLAPVPPQAETRSPAQPPVAPEPPVAKSNQAAATSSEPAATSTEPAAKSSPAGEPVMEAELAVPAVPPVAPVGATPQPAMMPAPLASPAMGCPAGAAQSSACDNRPWRFGNGPMTYGVPKSPFWYADVDAVALYRNATEHRPMATLGEEGDVVLDTSDLSLEFQPGFQAVIGCMLRPQLGIEFSSLVVSHWDDEVFTLDDTSNGEGGLGNLFSPLTNFGDPAVEGVDYNEQSRIHLHSAMGEWEVNLRQRLAMPCDTPMQVSLFYGLRYMDIRERFDYLTVSRVPGPMRSRNSIGVGTDNDLFGAQIGGIAQFHVDPRWWIDVRLMGAICGNSAEQNTLYVNRDADGATTRYDHGRSKTTSALVGEVGLDFRYQLTQRLWVRFGYQAIWVDGLALAEDNFADDLTALRSGPAALDHDGTLVYHGPHLGLGVRW